MAENQIAAIKARLSAATPGPWQHFPPPTNRLVAGGTNFETEVANCRVVAGHADAELIANAPADIEFLLAENRQLRRLVISLRTACEYALDTRDLGDLQRTIDASAGVRSEVAS